VQYRRARGGKKKLKWQQDLAPEAWRDESADDPSADCMKVKRQIAKVKTTSQNSKGFAL
jgi:hypothetical protein